MKTLEFKSSVAVADDRKVLIVLFNGEAEPSTVAVLKCTRETARAVKRAIGSALSDKDF